MSTTLDTIVAEARHRAGSAPSSRIVIANHVWHRVGTSDCKLHERVLFKDFCEASRPRDRPTRNEKDDVHARIRDGGKDLGADSRMRHSQ